MFPDKCLEYAHFVCSLVCHQMPERTLAAGVNALPLCARCTGIHAGIWAGMIWLLIFSRSRMGMLPSRGMVALLVAATACIIVEKYTVALGLPVGNNATRHFSGLFLGWTLALLMTPVLTAVSRGTIEKSTLSIWDKLMSAAWVVCVGTAVYLAPSGLYRPLALLQGLSVVALFTLGWGALAAYCWLLRRKRPMNVFLWLCVGLTLTVIQLAIMAQAGVGGWR